VTNLKDLGIGGRTLLKWFWAGMNWIICLMVVSYEDNSESFGLIKYGAFLD